MANPKQAGQNDLVKEIALQICSSLDIEIAMKRCLLLLNKIMPADSIVLNVLVPDLYAMRVIAHVSIEEENKLGKITPIPKEIWHEFEWEKEDHVRIFNYPESQDISKKIASYIGKKDISQMVMHIKIDGKELGQIALFADGINRYTEEHAGLFSLLNDPFANALSNALKHQELQMLKDMIDKENRYLRKKLLYLSGSDVIGEEFGLKDVMKIVRQVAPSDTPVLLLGETGVGKEVIANAIHSLSLRKEKQFIKVNCGAIPEHLVDSELFGHEKGAFTNAVTKKPGRFERAHTGSILLDEVGDLPFSAQAKLLRVLQFKEIERVGGIKTIPVDIRIIASTHRDLKNMVYKEQFREDLFFRLNIFPVIIPPLRERKEDIPALVDYFLKRKINELHLHYVPDIANGAIERLMDYDWPGNVRELENIIERALILARGQKYDKPLEFESLIETTQKDAGKLLLDNSKTPIKLDLCVTILIHNALRQAKGKVEGPGGAAEILGIKPNTLRGKMKKLGIPYGRGV